MTTFSIIFWSIIITAHLAFYFYYNHRHENLEAIKELLWFLISLVLVYFTYVIGKGG